jgi:excisionase family DNA binding protein
MTETLELLKPSQVCEALKISEATFYRLVRRNAIPVVRIGKSLRVRQTALDAYLKRAES